MDRKKQRLLKKAHPERKQLTPDEACKFYGFTDASELDKFALQLDAMALMMWEKKISDRPAMVEYIDKNFTSAPAKILAALFAGSKITENEWIEATTSEETRRNIH
jgi:hypothetical protein